MTATGRQDCLRGHWPEPAVSDQGDVQDGMRRALGTALRDARRSASLTQARLAARAGYARSTVANAETGRPDMSRAFCEAADIAVGTGGKLTAMHEDIILSRPRVLQAAAEAGHRAGTVQAAATVLEQAAEDLASAAKALRAIARSGQ